MQHSREYRPTFAAALEVCQNKATHSVDGQPLLLYLRSSRIRKWNKSCRYHQRHSTTSVERCKSGLAVILTSRSNLFADRK